MKRKFSEIENNQNKLISCTDIKNFFLKDTLVDWLKIYEKKENCEKDSNIFIEKGFTFEESIINYIHKSKCNIVKVSDKISDESCEKVVELINEGIPIITSAPFINKENGTKGIIDLLVRSDFINLLTEKESLNKEEILNNKGNPYYIVVDIKFSTLPLKKDGKHINNLDIYRFYKGQVYLYTQYIGNVQKYVSPYAFILGRRYKFKNKNVTYSSLNCLDRLGKIDFSLFDKHIKNEVFQAIKWLNTVRNEGLNWKIDPPSISELYPNMKVDSGEWNSRKLEIAKNISEITQIWNCGIKQRNFAHSKGVFSFKDPKCDSKLLGFKGKKALIVDNIININRNSNLSFSKTKINDNIEINLNNDGFVDFETFIDIFSNMEDLPIQKNTDFIFLIGLFWKNEYKYFISETPDINGEKQIIMAFQNFLKENNIKTLWFWHAEEVLWKKSLKRNNLTNNIDVKWCDLLKLCKNIHLCFKDCFGFSLKEIEKCMVKNNLIKSNDNQNVIINGLNAGVEAWQLYENQADQNFMDIIKYNKNDVKLLFEILKFINV